MKGNIRKKIISTSFFFFTYICYRDKIILDGDYVTNDGCYSIGSALSSSKPSSCVGSSGGGTSGGCKKIVKCITSAGSDAQCRSKISSLGGSYAGYNGKGDCIGNFCRSSCPSGSVETGGFY